MPRTSQDSTLVTRDPYASGERGRAATQLRRDEMLYARKSGLLWRAHPTTSRPVWVRPLRYGAEPRRRGSAIHRNLYSAPQAPSLYRHPRPRLHHTQTKRSEMKRKETRSRRPAAPVVRELVYSKRTPTPKTDGKEKQPRFSPFTSPQAVLPFPSPPSFPEAPLFCSSL